MSKAGKAEFCPCCRRQAKGKKASLVRLFRTQEELREKLVQQLLNLNHRLLVKGGLLPGKSLEQQWAKQELVREAEKLPPEKRTDAEGRALPHKALREQRHRRMDTLRQGNPLGWAGMFGGTDLVQPVSKTELPAPLSYEAMLKRDLHKAKQREYSREYYRKHKDRMNERRKLNRARQLAQGNGQS